MSRCTLHTRQLFRDSTEQCFDVVAGFRGRLHKDAAEFLGLGLALFRAYLALVAHVRLVCHQDEDDVVASFCFYIFDPFVDCLESSRT